ncbi:AMP-binding protein [Stigmatella erecta]|uniref:Acyl-CoA synthetase (AMP-forming)/AMP-acid ligase II n=1 Tax=Stigmatella erecta TaxID=83460 RepID=A0A1I0L9B9_9BACT|nr:AMP-binding protein [Stigmatella erecta]SEU35746.1 Acyl-CoA synthetase (AMP-forming)/AMP-acid ligase II [Stigmatella erecta]
MNAPKFNILEDSSSGLSQHEPRLLAALAGLPPGSRAVLAMRSGAALAFSLLTCFERRMVAVPIDPRVPEAKRQWYAAHAQASLLVTDEGCTPLATEAPPSPAEDRFIIYTSGSTGDPKGVVMTEASVRDNARAVAQLHRFRPGAVQATCLPVFHCNAMMMSVLGTHLAGATVALHNRFEPQAYFAFIEQTGAETASLAPALLERLVEAAPRWPSCLRYVITAAAPLPRELAQRFFALYGPRLRQGYGLSEATNFSAVMPELDEAAFRQEYLEARPPVGLPVPGTELRLQDGEVQVRGASVMRAYWRNPEATSRAFTPDGWLRTGDLGRMRGDYLVLTGRSKEVINRGGETVYPRDIEEEWEGLGLPRPFFALRIANDVLSDDIGVAGERLTSESLEVLARSRFKPGAAWKGPLAQTSTGKPRRAEMGKGLFSVSESQHKQELLLALSAATARKVLAPGRAPPRTPQAAFMHGEFARMLRELERYPHALPEPDASLAEVPAVKFLHAIEQQWEGLASGEASVEDVMRGLKGQWTPFMTEWPMGSYAQMAARFLIEGNHLSGRVLEVGAGVGNTTRLILEHVNDAYIRTDLKVELLKRLKAPGTVEAYNFDQPSPHRGLDTVFGVNAVHCAEDKLRAVGHLYEMLKPGGLLLLGEGAPTTVGTLPWSLNAAFGLFDGWWDRGGFLGRAFWIHAFETSGFSAWGYSILRAGRHDMGGLVWALK